MAFDVAIIGTGRMGRLFADVVEALPGNRVVWVASRTAEHAEALACRHGARASTDVNEVLADTALDAVVIATPAPTHAELAAAAAAAGKAVFLEKPLATSLDEGRELVAALEGAGVPAQVGFERRYDDGYVAAYRRLQQGELGEPETFRAVGRDPSPPPLDYLRSSGGLFVDLGIHDLDLARFLVGEVQEVSAAGGGFVPELAEAGIMDTAAALLRFENGALGTVELGLRTAYGYEVRTEVIGSLGRVVIEQQRVPDLIRYDLEGRHVTLPTGFDSRFQGAFANEVRAFVENVRAGAAVAPTPRDAWASLRLASATQHALETQTTVDVRAFGGSL